MKQTSSTQLPYLVIDMATLSVSTNVSNNAIMVSVHTSLGERLGTAEAPYGLVAEGHLKVIDDALDNVYLYRNGEPHKLALYNPRTGEVSVGAMHNGHVVRFVDPDTHTPTPIPIEKFGSVGELAIDTSGHTTLAVEGYVGQEVDVVAMAECITRTLATNRT